MGGEGRLVSINHHAPNRLALVHQVEGVVDLVERHGVGDEIVDIDLAFHIPIDDPRHIRASARAAEGGAFPDPSGHQLERPRLDFGAGRRDPDDDALAPPLVATFERLPHDHDIAGAIERVIRQQF